MHVYVYIYIYVFMCIYIYICITAVKVSYYILSYPGREVRSRLHLLMLQLTYPIQTRKHKNNTMYQEHKQKTYCS